VKGERSLLETRLLGKVDKAAILGFAHRFGSRGSAELGEEGLQVGLDRADFDQR